MATLWKQGAKLLKCSSGKLAYQDDCPCGEFTCPTDCTSCPSTYTLSWTDGVIEACYDGGGIFTRVTDTFSAGSCTITKNDCTWANNSCGPSVSRYYEGRALGCDGTVMYSDTISMDGTLYLTCSAYDYGVYRWGVFADFGESPPQPQFYYAIFGKGSCPPTGTVATYAAEQSTLISSSVSWTLE